MIEMDDENFHSNKILEASILQNLLWEATSLKYKEKNKLFFHHPN